MPDSIFKGLEMKTVVFYKIILLNDLDMQLGNTAIKLLNSMIKAYKYLKTNNALFAAGLFLEDTHTVLQDYISHMLVGKQNILCYNFYSLTGQKKRSH